MTTAEECRREMEAIWPVPDPVWRRLQGYVNSLEHWQRTQNLVAPSTLPMIWRRHVLDSWQLMPLVSPAQPGGLVDLGAGAGLPGLVLAIGGVPDVHLIESNQRKAAFLRFAVSQTGMACRVHAARAEAVSYDEIGPIATVTARALAGLTELFRLALPLTDSSTQLVFPKGRRWRGEVAEARKSYLFDFSVCESVTESEAVVLRIRNLRKR